MKKLHLFIGNIISKSIASKLDDFMYDFDPYEYRDNCENRENGYNIILDYLRKDSTECFFMEEFLEGIIEELSYDEDKSKLNEEYIKRANKILKNIASFRRFRFKYCL